MYKYSHLSHVTSWHRRTFCDIWALSWAQTWIYTYLRAEMNEFNWMRCDTIYFALAWQTSVKWNWLYKFWFHLAFCHSALNIGSHTHTRAYLHCIYFQFHFDGNVCVCVALTTATVTPTTTTTTKTMTVWRSFVNEIRRINEQMNRRSCTHRGWMGVDATGGRNAWSTKYIYLFVAVYLKFT